MYVFFPKNMMYNGKKTGHEMRKQEHTITSFLFTTCGANEKDCSAYSAVKTEDAVKIKLIYYVEGTGLAEAAFDRDFETLEALSRLAESLELDKWNGFTPFSLTKLEAPGFTLDVRFADKSHIYACSYVHKPKNYEDAFAAIRRFFADLALQ